MIAGILFVAAAVAIAAYVFHLHTPKIVQLLRSGDVEGIETYIENEGKKGWFVLILLQVLETVSIILPALPVYICAGAVYGKIAGILMCYITNLVMNLLIFLAARKMKVTSEEFLQFEKNPKLEEWMQKTTHPDRLVLIMCLLPIIPNGLIPYISSQTAVTARDFMKMLAVGCLPSIVFFVCSGDLLVGRHFHLTWPVVLLFAVLIAIIMIFRRRITVWLEPRIEKFI